MTSSPIAESDYTDQAELDIDRARQAVSTEIVGLQALIHDTLNAEFAKAVDIIHAMRETGKGRLIVTGMGKSGHIARKMAATFASTGMASMFVHPGEASHGDLGMITPDDVVLGLSNSGNTVELNDTLQYCKRFAIPLIAITSGRSSTLAEYSDVALILPNVDEACPNGMAPTTSTTMTLVLGDALAVCLLQRLGLDKEQFNVFHPGGRLGQRLMKVKDIMDPLDSIPVMTDLSTTMDKAIVAMSEYNLGCVVMADAEGAILGLITDGDLKRHMGVDLLAKTVADVMTPNPRSIPHDRLAVEAVEVMTQGFKQPITSLLVEKDGKLAGLVRLQNCVMQGIA